MLRSLAEDIPVISADARLDDFGVRRVVRSRLTGAMHP
jgi:hypothetical protein